MKYEFIHAHRSSFAVKKMCQVLDVSRSGYYDWRYRSESQRSRDNRALVRAIKDVHDKSDKTYGSPRITVALHYRGFSCSRPRVARLMSAEGIKAKTKKKHKVTTNANHSYPVAPNLLGQEFWTNAAHRIWMSDITYISTWEGWLYLTVILDLFSRKVVGWSMSNTLQAGDTTIPALMQAVARYQPLPGVIFHSDRGVQYACEDFRGLLDHLHMVQSMSGTGNCYDNAVVESFFHTLKTELVYHRAYQSRLEAKRSLFEYMEVFYNRFRMHSALNYRTPEQYEQSTINQNI